MHYSPSLGRVITALELNYALFLSMNPRYAKINLRAGFEVANLAQITHREPLAEPKIGE